MYRIATLAAVFAALSSMPASAALVVNDALGASIARPAPSMQLAAMMSYTWSKGQKSGGIKSTPTPPPPPPISKQSSNVRGRS